MIKHCLLASTILAGALGLSVPASAITIGGAALKSQPAVSGTASDSTLLIQVKGARGGKGGSAKGKGGGGDADDDDDQGDDDQGDDNDDQGDDEQ
jgi:hypothetical protein